MSLLFWSCPQDQIGWFFKSYYSSSPVCLKIVYVLVSQGEKWISSEVFGWLSYPMESLKIFFFKIYPACESDPMTQHLWAALHKQYDPVSLPSSNSLGSFQGRAEPQELWKIYFNQRNSFKGTSFSVCKMNYLKKFHCPSKSLLEVYL